MAPDLLYLRASNALWLKKASLQSPMRLTSTNLAILALLIGAAIFGQALQKRFTGTDSVTFEPIEGLPGWRLVAFDNVTLPGGTATSAVFAGLGETTDTMDRDALCTFLYPDANETLQAAHFSDLNCPNCQPMERKLRARLNVNRIELPLLGQSSENYAKAMIAISLQEDTPGIRAKDFLQFRQQAKALQTGRPGLHPTIAEKAEEIGLNADTIKAAIKGREVADRLRLNHAAANTLGIYGTPGTTIGSTLIMGDVNEVTLDTLIKLENARTDGAC